MHGDYLYLKGSNLWRADRIMLLGISLGHDAFVIAPDMNGIIVTVPAVAAIPGERAFKEDSSIHVLTPLGEGRSDFSYDPALSGESCKAKPVQAAAADDPKAVTVSKVEPSSFVVPSIIRIEVTGANLGKVDEVRLDARKGAITERVADGTGFVAEFAREVTEGMEQGTAKLQLSAAKKAVGTAQPIRIVRD